MKSRFLSTVKSKYIVITSWFLAYYRRSYLVFPIVTLFFLSVFSGFSFAWSRPFLPTLPTAPTPPVRIKICTQLIRQMNNSTQPLIQNQYLKLLKRYNECRIFAQLTDAFTESNHDQSLLTELVQNNLLSKEILDTFSDESIANAQEQAFTEQGELLTIKIDPNIQVEGDWMESFITVKSETSTTKYLVVWHFENGGWKIFGTQTTEI